MPVMLLPWLKTQVETLVTGTSDMHMEPGQNLVLTWF